ncbi:hypothetical protein KKB28_07090, partial [bacterium]|nr:hypothetical protein [bacterium]
FNDHPEYKKDWDRAKREADSHLSKLLSLKIWSPYPILSYCLGAAETMDTKIHIRYFLFPLSSPTEQEHAVAQVIFETEIGASPGDIERIWVDALRENELSHDNVRHIRQAID